MTSAILADLYKVRVWDGDGFVDIKRPRTPFRQHAPELLCLVFHTRPNFPSARGGIIVDDKKFVATKFMAHIFGHVFGGVIDYQHGSKALVGIYNNDQLAACMRVPPNFTTMTVGVVCNEDSRFGSRGDSYVTYYY